VIYGFEGGGSKSHTVTVTVSILDIELLTSAANDPATAAPAAIHSDRLGFVWQITIPGQEKGSAIPPRPRNSRLLRDSETGLDRSDRLPQPGMGRVLPY